MRLEVAYLQVLGEVNTGRAPECVKVKKLKYGALIIFYMHSHWLWSRI